MSRYLIAKGNIIDEIVIETNNLVALAISPTQGKDPRREEIKRNRILDTNERVYDLHKKLDSLNPTP